MHTIACGELCAFVTDLKLKARTGNFGELQDSLICDQIVFGINDKKVRERLLRDLELTLAGALKICQASELALQHAKTFGNATKHCTKTMSSILLKSVANVEGRITLLSNAFPKGNRVEEIVSIP